MARLLYKIVQTTQIITYFTDFKEYTFYIQAIYRKFTLKSESYSDEKLV